MLLKISNLSKSFNNRKILDSVSLELDRGEVLVIMGRSGCGKSVLLRCICGLLPPDSGSVEFYPGKGSDKTDGSFSGIGMVFQSGALLDYLSVFDNVALPLRAFSDLDEKNICRKTMSLLEELDLVESAEACPPEISGGMKRRTAIARVLACEPELILYDEPTVGLDPEKVSEINRLIVRLTREKNVSALVVTHDIESARAVADKAALHYHGAVSFLSDGQSFFSGENPFVKEFIDGCRK